MIQSPDCRYYRRDTEVDRGVSVADLCDGTNGRLSCRKPAGGGRQQRRERKRSPTSHLREKKRQANLTTRWLKQNYRACPDVCLPREIVYEQYLEFCRIEKIPPACKATFGKLMRNTFPDVSSKRLGARGHSKYHYNGIGLKQGSEFCNPNPAFQGLTRFSSASTSSEGTSPKKFCLSSKVGTRLPSFPRVEDLVITDAEDRVKMATFILMYRTHCQCILHVIISGNFEEIRVFLLHFWQGFPEHLMSLTKLDVFIDLVTICDCILYRALLDVLIPSLTFEITEKLLQSIHNVGLRWNFWVESSLENMPRGLIEAKKATAKRFCRTLKRCVAFMHLAQVARPILASDGPPFLHRELENYLEEFVEYSWSPSAEWLCEKNEFDMTTQQATELQNILGNCRSIDLLINALDKMLLRVKGWNEQVEDKAATRNFIFNWVYMLSKVSCILTRYRSRHFTTFHILSSLIQEYLLLAVENQQDREHEDRIHRRFQKLLKNSGDVTSEASKTPLPPSEANPKHPTHANYLAKKSKKLREETGRHESHTLDVTCRYNAEMYPRTCTYYSRTDISPQTWSSCKYAPGSCPEYEYHPSSTTAGYPDVCHLPQQVPATPLTRCLARPDRVFSSPSDSIRGSTEIYSLERNSVGANVDTSHETFTGINESYQPFIAQMCQYHY